MVISADGLFALPRDTDPRQLSMLAINPPTAALLLSEYVNLEPGEWVVQNAANSGVGRWVIAFAKMRGLKTVNIVRRPELVPELEAIGGDLVVVDSPDVSERINRLSVRLSSASRLMVSAARRRACSQRRSRRAARSSALRP
jgi:NADPH:quinone reductase-like Zn-dependent oxidoreductase